MKWLKSCIVNGMWKHWVVRANTPHEPFKDFETARWTWARLSQLFPEKICAVVMPNHLHLILPQETEANRKITSLLIAISKKKNQPKLWQSIPPPAEVPDPFHLRRQVRYVALNPCRKKLCADPLSWYWSTYRELMGITPNLKSVAELARQVGEPEKNFRVRFHLYVSGDPSVQTGGTPLPVASPPKILPEESIKEILAASAGALRVSPLDVQKQSQVRSLFIHLAYRHGWQQPLLLSKICKITPRAVHQILKRAPPLGISAGDLCLGDRRLRPDASSFQISH